MKNERINLWKEDEYDYKYAYGFVPNMRSYLHDDGLIHPCMLIAPGGGYVVVSPTEGEIVAKKFYEMGYNAFVVTYTTNMLMKEPLKDRSMKDLSRAVRLVRKNSEKYGIHTDQVIVCGFSAAGHLCASLCVHYEDVHDVDSELEKISNRPDGAILSYPVITAGEFAHRGSFDALIGDEPSKEDSRYYSLETQVSKNTPPTFLWHTVTDETVPVENGIFYEEALRKAGVNHAMHLFSEGHHGLSLGNKIWADRIFGEPYALEQTVRTLDAVRNDKVDITPDEKERILRDFNIDDSGKEIEYPEIELWPELADIWIREKITDNK